MTAGREGSLRRRGTAAKTSTAATATAKEPAHGPSKGSPSTTTTKRKAAKDDPAPSPSPPRPRATPRTTTATAAAALSDEQIDEFRRLSNSDIGWLLSLKPMKPPARFAALKRSNPELTPLAVEEDADEDKRRLYRLAKTFFELEENLPATQAWVRSELRKKGYVELDEERARHRAEVQALIDQKWPAIEEKMKSLFVDEKEDDQDQGGGESGDCDEGEGCDDESDDEEDEVD